ncbi:ABC transporter ATP-binding protein [Periweissella fabalis]|uniref:ABC transporter ATP-binding protein n=1 Tax=Periweissella fabalis TaxID=1070421 RepID=A0A7X6S330_9LACO|nr:ABC transporter ATP-binding protein [Periweissella fabalis]MCM0598167.1 ABC transporter ATP-binding protein [Periweissella fabalis]NKZ24709.1 ABC transporter ATP-binding protein [Periweissella fabalis]
MDVRFEHVSLAYANKQTNILTDINFKIPAGQLTCLLGPSGCGKSTTLNLISGLLEPTKGQIFFGDKDVTRLDALERKVGMVFQSYALYPHMTVLENICFPLRMAKMAKAEMLKRATELAQLVHVDAELTKKPGELSGGQQQRVAIARALAKSPSILLLDEPLSNLDARLRVEMRDEIRRIQKETGVTTIFVTHDQDEAMHIADQIMILNNGTIQQFAAPNTIYAQPQNLFVAKFIGNPVINTIALNDHHRTDFVKLVPKDILAKATTLAIRAESIVPINSVDTLTHPFSGIQLETYQFGPEVTTQIAYHGVPITSNQFNTHTWVNNQHPIPFELHKNGYFLCDSNDNVIWPLKEPLVVTR